MRSAYIKIAIWFASILLSPGVAAGQQRAAAPDSHSPQRSLSSEPQSVPCTPQPATTTMPFDTCKYLALGPGIHAPHPLSIVNPKYSDAARKAKINGSVVVAVAVNEKGDVDEVKVVRSLDRGLDQNAMAAAKQSKFAPATKDSKPVAVQMNMEMTFKLY